MYAWPRRRQRPKHTPKLILEALIQEAGWSWSAQNSVVMMAYLQNFPDFSGMFHTIQKQDKSRGNCPVIGNRFITCYCAQCRDESVLGKTKAEQNLAET